MTRLIQCDRCGATAPLDEALRRQEWTAVYIQPDDDDESVLLASLRFAPWFEVCPDCQTAGERAQQDEQRRLDLAEDERWGTSLHP